jgi:putative hemolysin
MDWSNEKLRWGVLVTVGVLFAVVIYGRIADEYADAEREYPSPRAHIRAMINGMRFGGTSDKAFEFCKKVGGVPQYENRPGMGKYTSCRFQNGFECEGNAMLDGRCAEGGVDTSKINAPSGRYCMMRGGQYAITEKGDVRNERGTCKFPSKNITCDATDYWMGKCIEAQGE